jgi:hypothetical protein
LESHWFVNSLIEQFEEVVAKNHAMVLNGEVMRITKSQPRLFIDFAKEHKER